MVCECASRIGLALHDFRPVLPQRLPHRHWILPVFGSLGLVVVGMDGKLVIGAAARLLPGCCQAAVRLLRGCCKAAARRLPGCGQAIRPPTPGKYQKYKERQGNLTRATRPLSHQYQ